VAYDRDLGEFHANLGLNVQRRTGGTNAQLPRVTYAPNFKANLMLYRPIPDLGWGGSLLINTVSDYGVDNAITEVVGGQASEVDGFTTVDLNVTRGMGSGLEAGLTVKNLFDEDHNEIVNGVPGRPGTLLWSGGLRDGAKGLLTLPYPGGTVGGNDVTWAPRPPPRT
jgi:outer membrane receptor protein involved in Fe transport